MTPGESVVSPNQLLVTPGYLEALRVPLRRGRFFADSDTADAPGVVIVDERLAQRFWPNVDPIGRRMYMPRTPEDVAKPGPKAKWMHVVGVVGTVKLRGLIEGEDARAGAFYLPYAQDPSRELGFAIRWKRTSGDAAVIKSAVERALVELDPNVQLSDSFVMSDRIERSLDSRRAPMLLLVAFGVVALLLASLGIYGVLAYQVSQRTREFGIRIALGSNAREILRLVVGEAVVLMLVGLAFGLAGAIVLRGVITSQLHGVGALDPQVILSATLVLAAAALVACIGPSRRATRVNPVVALQSW
jgi:hypothetical protein